MTRHKGAKRHVCDPGQGDCTEELCLPRTQMMILELATDFTSAVAFYFLFSASLHPFRVELGVNDQSTGSLPYNTHSLRLCLNSGAASFKVCI